MQILFRFPRPFRANPRRLRVTVFVAESWRERERERKDKSKREKGGQGGVEGRGTSVK